MAWIEIPDDIDYAHVCLLTDMTLRLLLIFTTVYRLKDSLLHQIFQVQSDTSSFHK